MPADLTKIPLFKGLQGDALRELGGRTAVRVLPADALLIKEGDPADSLYVILRGKVKVYLSDANGKEFVVDVRSAGQYIGEMMLDDNPRSANVRTLEPSEFAVVPSADFKALLGRHPEVALQVIRNLIRLTRGHNVQTLKDVRTRGELQQYISQLEATKAQDLPSVRRWAAAKRWVLASLLVLAVLQFYFLDVFLKIMSLGRVAVFTGQ